MESVFTADQLAMLNKPLTRDEIETKSVSGSTLTYIATWAAVKKANAIFKPGNWGYEISGDFQVFETGKNKNGITMYRIEVPVTLTIRGCIPIREIGDCEAQGDSAGAQSMGRKGAVSDGLKRCLKNMGEAFGLDLYDKDWRPEPEQSQQQQPTRNAPPPAPQRPEPPATPPLPPTVSKSDYSISLLMDRLNGIRTLDQLNALTDDLKAAQIPHDHPRRKELTDRYGAVKKDVENREFGPSLMRELGAVGPVASN